MTSGSSIATLTVTLEPTGTSPSLYGHLPIPYPEPRALRLPWVVPLISSAKARQPPKIENMNIAKIEMKVNLLFSIYQYHNFIENTYN
ncbi:MAG: hypothetical protein ACTSRS_20830 [Candidatus Helarchaeota archaeon]